MEFSLGERKAHPLLPPQWLLQQDGKGGVNGWEAQSNCGVVLLLPGSPCWEPLGRWWAPEGHNLWRPAGGDLERSGASVMGGKFCGGCVMMLLFFGCPSTPGLMWQETMTLTKVGKDRSESRLNWRVTGKTNLDSNLAELVFECEALSYGGRR